MIVILGNTASLAMFHRGQSMDWINAYDTLEIVFTVAFTVGTILCV